MLAEDVSPQAILVAKRPEELFSGDLDEAKDLYRKLANRWHPDKPGGNAEVMARVNDLYEVAVERIKNGVWGGKSSVKFKLKNGKELRFQYLVSRPFEFGQTYIGDTHVSTLFEKERVAFAEAAEKSTRKFSFASDKMREEMERFLPKDVKTFELEDGRVLVKTPKAEDLVALRDVFEHFGGTMDSKHVAWVGSGLHNIACYLGWAKLVHANISLDSVFISPASHGVALLGGWWYAAKEDARLTHLPSRTYAFLPWEVRTHKRATYLIDQEMIRATLRELLGDIDGTKLKDPPALVSWLKTPAEGAPVDIYRSWHAVLTPAFGKRRFTVMKLDVSEVYSTRR